MSIAIDDSSNVYPTGYSAFSGGNELITIKYNTNGERKWIRKNSTFNGDYLRPASVTVDKYGNIIANGYYYLFGNYAFITIKYNSEGDTLWKRIYKGDGNLNFCHALTTDDSGNVYAAGRSTNTGTGADFVTIKYFPNGDTAWIRKYDGGFNQFDEAYSIAVDDYQNVYVTGMSDSTDGLSDYLTMKYDSDGNINWIKKYNGYFLVDRSFCLSIDNNYNIIISGFAQKNINDAWITSIKYSQFTGVSGNDIDYNFNSVLFQNYPNPFNPATNIKYHISSSGLVSVKIYDISGKEIGNLVNEYQNSGNHVINFDINNFRKVENLSSGIYIYSLLLNGNIIGTKKNVFNKIRIMKK
ncbi:MAG: SBBP repeat-containing protein [Ignavibacteria bacterium]|nr:SBBP repeat-containing protein [Ignavibacteria bacterium]